MNKGELLLGSKVVFINDDNKIYGIITGYDDFTNEYFINGSWYKLNDFKLITNN